jgi:hypothetical protein
MKIKFLPCFVILCLSSLSVFSQKLTFGIENGINYSNLRKTYDYNRYASQPGPLNGFVVKYDLMNWVTIQSGANNLSYYFNEYNYYINYDETWKNYLSLSDNIMPTNDYAENSNFSFLRIPLLVKFRTPGRVNFEIGGGAYYAFLTNDEFRGKDRNLYTKEYIDEYFPKMNDWGWILASTVNYNINNQWSVFVSGQVTYGHEKYFKNVDGKMGSSEITLGIGYKPFNAKKQIQMPDSIGQKVSVLPHTGINISQGKSNKNGSSYKASVGLSSGVSLKFLLGDNFAIITGTWYDRKGYNLDNTGYQSAIFIPANEQTGRHIVSEVQLDYLTIPMLMDISFGGKIVNHINMGAYFSLLQNAFAEGERTSRSDYEQGYEISKQFFNESLDLCFKHSDVGFLAAYRIDFPVFKWADAFISVNQLIGFENILNNSGEAQWTYHFIDDQKIHNWSTSVLFGLSIPVNKNLKP